MPFALLFAIAASFGIHAVLLFGPDIDLSYEPESSPLMAELKPMPQPPPPPPPPPPPKRKIESVTKHDKQTSAKAKPSRKRQETDSSAMPLPRPPEVLPGQFEAPPVEAERAVEPESEPASVVRSRMPDFGRILYRVDRGDMKFEIGKAAQDWEIVDGRYRLYSVAETTGLVRLFKSYRIEMESRGSVTAEGFRPEMFVIRRNGKETKEKVLFDWDKMKVRVGDQTEQALDSGAQDLLSFNYQLGFLPLLKAGGSIAIATGRKYGVYHLEVLGDEEIELPAGVLRTLHLRAPGVNSTELWLAYAYLMLPVKIRHVDSKGDSLVQVAIKIEVSPE